MKYIYDDGGREQAGRRGLAGDCVTRAVAIASGLPYSVVYAALASGNAGQRITKRSSKSRAGRRTASSGIDVRRQWFREYMHSLGFKWQPTMGIGTGCRVHLRDGELPDGRLVVAVSRHSTAVIDGVIRDTYDPSRDGNRCVYGYWIKQTRPTPAPQELPS